MNEAFKPFALLVSALGILIVILPLIYLPSPGGALAFPVLIMKGTGIVVGLGVVSIGLHSYRTGDPRPAVATGLTVIGLVTTGVLGGLVETTGGGFLVPIWMWFLASILVIGIAFLVAYRFVDETNG